MNLKEDKDEGLRQRYAAMAARFSGRSPILSDCLKAFLVGGLICVVGEGVSRLGIYGLRLTPEHGSAFTSVVMVFLGALLTGIGVYDRIGCFAGAGSAVPITGFANSVVAPAMEFHTEGIIMGTGARIFSIAGPVLVHGLLTSIVMGLLHMIW